MDSSILTDLLTVLPDWASRLDKLRLSRFPDHAGLVPINPCPPEKRDPRNAGKPRSKSSILMAKEEEGLQQVDSAAKKLHQKPNANKARFSSLTGPEIMYDGEAQRCLFDCWTALNSNRGHLRKEMMSFKRKRIMALPTTGFEYDSDDDDLDAGSSDEEEEEVETPEAREKRIAEEKKKAEEEKKKAEIDKERAAMLEYIDSRLDKAARACESAAFLWLKGASDGYAGHVLYINQRMMEAVDKINRERGQETKATVTVQPNQDQGTSKAMDDDEGFEDDDAGYASEELPHKMPVQRRISGRPDLATRLQHDRYRDRYRDLGIDS